MNKTTKRTIFGFNSLGIISALFVVGHLVIFLYLGEETENSYIIGSFFTSLILTILSFGFAKIIEMLCEIHGELTRDE